jgi:hypothetical protein
MLEAAQNPLTDHGLTTTPRAPAHAGARVVVVHLSTIVYEPAARVIARFA